MCDTPCLEKVFSRINAKFDQFNTLKSIPNLEIKFQMNSVSRQKTDLEIP